MSRVSTKFIEANAVTNAKLAQLPTLTLKGNNTGGSSDPLDLTVSQVQTMLSISPAFAWSVVTGTTQSIVKNNGYVANNSSQVVFTLPSTAAVGDIFSVAGFGTGGWKIAQNAGQSIQFSATSTTVGTTGYIINTDRYSTVTVVCTVADTQFQVISSQGVFGVPAPYTITYLVVAGGGSGNGGSAGGGGGGGAGGFLTSTASLTVGATYTITVGSGGVFSVNSVNGTNSVLSGTGISTVTASGGGGAHSAAVNGDGGSGGGGSNSSFPSGGNGTGGQGNNGGTGDSSGASFSGGGGGGASATGGNGSTNTGTGGAGGAGTASSITGSSVTYAGGGGGGGQFFAGAGGSGGGASGATAGNTGSNATANTGGGGGGGQNGGNGASGVVILSVPTANYTGTTTGSPTVTTSGGNTILKFTSSGSYTA